MSQVNGNSEEYDESRGFYYQLYEWWSDFSPRDVKIKPKLKQKLQWILLFAKPGKKLITTHLVMHSLKARQEGRNF